MQDNLLAKDLSDEKFDTADNSSRISYSDVAEKLLIDKLLLTALELHCELTEAGKEVPKLKEFFSNPGNFESQSARAEISPSGITRWSSQATLDSLDLTRYSEDGEKYSDDRIAVLEFELRKAKETISALRANLTVATESENQAQDGTHSSKSTAGEPIKPHEQRALNFLINEYLLLHGYKLTSITFADENEDQDFEVWDDVGLNIPKPPELLYLYRDSMKHSGNSDEVDSYNVECQTDMLIDQTETLITECESLRKRISELESENNGLSEHLERLKKDTLEPDMSHFAAPVSDSGSSHDHFVMIEPSNQPDVSDNKPETLHRRNDSNQLSASVDDQIKRVNIAEDENDDDVSDDNSGIESLGSNNEWTKVNSPSAESNNLDDYIGLAMSLVQNSNRNLPVAFQKELFSRCFINPGRLSRDVCSDDVNSELTSEKIVHTLASCLYSITPHISVNKREEVILLIAYTIKLHSDFKMREKLIRLLFNLKKKPHEPERKPILAGIVWLVHNCDAAFVENELLPFWWEQSSHKYIERKLLICEACSCIVPYISNAARTSFLLPLLQQMLLEDKEDRIRISAINCIAFIAALIDGDDKYSQCEELAFTGLQDHSGDVVQCTTAVMLPIIGKWAFDTNRLQSHLFTRLLNVLASQIKSAISQHREESSCSPFKQSLCWETRCVWTIMAIRSLLPYLVMFVATVPEVVEKIHPNLPLAEPRTGFAELCRGLCNPAIFCDGKHGLGGIMSAFDACINESVVWPQLEWVVNHMIEKLLDCLDQISSSQNDLLTSYISLFHSIVSGFGKQFTISKIKPVFQVRLQHVEANLANMSTESPSLCILPVYLLAVLAPLQDVETAQETLRRFLVALSLIGYPLDIIQFSVKLLSCNGNMEESLMNSLWDGVIHQRELVRNAVLKLFVSVIPNVSHFSITNRIIPALVTLSNDADLNVKISTIPVFGTLINQISIKEVSDKCYFQIQTFLSEPTLYDHHSMLIQLISTLGDVASKCDTTFRDDVLIPNLSTFSSYCAQLSNASKRHDLIGVLVDAYTAVSYCSLSRNVVNNCLLPGLRSIEYVASESPAPYQETIMSLIKDIESRYGIESSATSQPPASYLPNVSQDMKQKMSKIFQTPIAKHSMFWKK